MKISSKLLLILPIGIAFVLAGCATSMQSPVEGYLCCNQTSAKGWLSSENILGGNSIPLGSKVRVTTIKRDRYAYGTIAGSEYGLSHDAAKTFTDTVGWLEKIVIKTDPTIELERWPGPVKVAVSASRIFVGMTKPQVLMAIGYPAASLTPDTKSITWKYWTTIDDDPVVLQFDSSGILEKIIASPTTLRIVQLAM